MTPLAAALAALSPRGEGWVWWLGLVAVLALAALLVLVLRRRLLRPMTHEPTDTTDSWVEAGRRVPLKPPAEDSEDSPGGDLP